MEQRIIDQAFIAGFDAASSNAKRIPMIDKLYQDLIKQTKFKLVAEIADVWIKGYECYTDASLGTIFKNDAYFVERSKKAISDYNAHKQAQ